MHTNTLVRMILRMRATLWFCLYLQIFSFIYTSCSWHQSKQKVTRGHTHTPSSYWQREVSTLEILWLPEHCILSCNWIHSNSLGLRLFAAIVDMEISRSPKLSDSNTNRLRKLRVVIYWYFGWDVVKPLVSQTVLGLLVCVFFRKTITWELWIHTLKRFDSLWPGFLHHFVPFSELMCEM